VAFRQMSGPGVWGISQTDLAFREHYGPDTSRQAAPAANDCGLGAADQNDPHGLTSADSGGKMFIRSGGIEWPEGRGRHPNEDVARPHHKEAALQAALARA